MGKPIKVSPQHEQIILGAMLSDTKLRKVLVKRIEASDFFIKEHRTIFAGIQRLEEERLECIPVTLKSFLPSGEEWGGIEYLEKLPVLASDANLDYHLERAKWDCVRNTFLTDRIPALTALLVDPRTNPEQVAHTVKQLSSMLRQEGPGRIETGKAHVAQYNAELYARGAGGTIRTTGYAGFDRKLTSPFKPGWMTVIAASSSIGKTTFCLNMGERQAESGWKVGYASWESGSLDSTDILIASALKIPLSILLKRPHDMTTKQIRMKNELLERLFDNNSMFSFIKPPPKSVLKQNSAWAINDAVLDYMYSVVEEHGFDIVYWDLFEKKLPDRRPQAISWALDRAQEMAQELHFHNTLLHQVTLKEAERQDDTRPTRYNLKGSGGYVETPDFVFGLWRRAVYERGTKDKELELYCLKQRKGAWPFRMIFEWDGQYGYVGNCREAEMSFVNEDEEGV